MKETRSAHEFISYSAPMGPCTMIRYLSALGLDLTVLVNLCAIRQWRDCGSAQSPVLWQSSIPPIVCPQTQERTTSAAWCACVRLSSFAFASSAGRARHARDPWPLARNYAPRL